MKQAYGELFGEEMESFAQKPTAEDNADDIAESYWHEVFNQAHEQNAETNEE